jgi:hypothetical protein
VDLQGKVQPKAVEQRRPAGMRRKAWHGATNGTEIKNRRSTLLGEMGYGLGVCGT